MGFIFGRLLRCVVFCCWFEIVSSVAYQKVEPFFILKMERTAIEGMFPIYS
jgi:hypothetical protein